MKIIIIGGGTVGAAICSQLVQEGHDLTVVDINQNILNEILFISAVMSKTDTEKAVGDMTDEFIRTYESPEESK
jgi:Trk K+ transport system NAD-binding subunit